jgi:hypothetical protein
VDDLDFKATTAILNAAAEEAVNRLRSNLSIGLSEAEAHFRQTQFCPNLVPEEKPHWINDFAKRFWGLSA